MDPAKAFDRRSYLFCDCKFYRINLRKGTTHENLSAKCAERRRLTKYKPMVMLFLWTCRVTELSQCNYSRLSNLELYRIPLNMSRLGNSHLAVTFTLYLVNEEKLQRVTSCTCLRTVVSSNLDQTLFSVPCGTVAMLCFVG